jgi:glyoxylase-like metal-dependent hydrolase (beta-lactamase superfamily II)/rhodanese-related sulfurtransferase
VIQEIDVETLQAWLTQGKPVKVLDVRPAQDRELWWIPGSEHVDAYESLKHGSAGALANIALPEDQVVVTVCGVGRASTKAAEILAAERGIPAVTLRGGMKAWSLAWNMASRSFGTVEITQLRRTGKGCLSYFIRSGTEAAVIDPSVEPEAYLSLAREQGVRISAVLDTHVHADHLSRARLLAEKSGAQLYLPLQHRVRYSHATVTDGDTVRIGAISLKVLSTPGHTAESTTYLIPDVGIFTGDTLFLAGVGRPDLHAAEQESEARSRLLYSSLLRLTSLDPRLLVFPGHTSQPVPFDGILLTAPIGEVSARLSNWLSSEEEFVHRILAGIPPTPPNYVVISEANESGDWPDSDSTDLEAGANRCAVS